MKQNILLVDDDETFCELVGDILKFEGYGFSFAYNGSGPAPKSGDCISNGDTERTGNIFYYPFYA